MLLDSIKKYSMNTLINQTKWGNCTLCPKENIACVKIGKDLVCMNCNNSAKAIKSLAKATLKNKARGLIKYQHDSGLVDSLSELTIDLDRVVSRYVRLLYMGLDNKIECYTCGVRKEFAKMQAGHFISRKHLLLRWDVTHNIRPQCGECNMIKSGNLKLYAINLEIEQKGIVEWLIDRSRVVENTTKTELKMLLSDFQQKLKIVEVKLK